MVVDEADKPVANAEVSVARAMCEVLREDGVQSFEYLSGKLAARLFRRPHGCRRPFPHGEFSNQRHGWTDGSGDGKSSCAKRRTFPPAPSALPWSAGQEDIKFVVEPFGGIEGKIVVEGSIHPLPVARLTLQPDGAGFYPAVERVPAQSGADGAFRVSDVAAGSYRMQAVFRAQCRPGVDCGHGTGFG